VFLWPGEPPKAHKKKKSKKHWEKQARKSSLESDAGDASAPDERAWVPTAPEQLVSQCFVGRVEEVNAPTSAHPWATVDIRWMYNPADIVSDALPKELKAGKRLPRELVLSDHIDRGQPMGSIVAAAPTVHASELSKGAALEGAPLRDGPFFWRFLFLQNTGAVVLDESGGLSGAALRRDPELYAKAGARELQKLPKTPKRKGDGTPKGHKHKRQKIGKPQGRKLAASLEDSAMEDLLTAAAELDPTMGALQWAPAENPAAPSGVPVDLENRVQQLLEKGFLSFSEAARLKELGRAGHHGVLEAFAKEGRRWGESRDPRDRDPRVAKDFVEALQEAARDAWESVTATQEGPQATTSTGGQPEIAVEGREEDKMLVSLHLGGGTYRGWLHFTSAADPVRLPVRMTRAPDA